MKHICFGGYKAYWVTLKAYRLAGTCSNDKVRLRTIKHAPYACVKADDFVAATHLCDVPLRHDPLYAESFKVVIARARIKRSRIKSSFITINVEFWNL